MKMKLNCWEIKKCGRGPNDTNVSGLGSCPVAKDFSSNGINGGKNGGRICWDIPHTLCEGTVQHNFSLKAVSCVSCEVFIRVKSEEGSGNFSLLKIFHSGPSADMIDDAEVESDIVVNLPDLPPELVVYNSAGECMKYKRSSQ
ncbi:MAG: two-CW domain-containing protein [Nitrospirota bacterium]